MYRTIVRNVVDESTRIEMASLLLPAAKDKMMRIKDMSRSPDTTVHHQCSIFANRNRNVHKFEDSVINARAVTRPWRSAVRTAIPIEDQRKPVVAELLG
jgi:hypothetical protein